MTYKTLATCTPACLLLLLSLYIPPRSLLSSVMGLLIEPAMGSRASRVAAMKEWPIITVYPLLDLLFFFFQETPHNSVFLIGFQTSANVLSMTHSYLQEFNSWLIDLVYQEMTTCHMLDFAFIVLTLYSALCGGVGLFSFGSAM